MTEPGTTAFTVTLEVKASLLTSPVTIRAGSERQARAEARRLMRTIKETGRLPDGMTLDWAFDLHRLKLFGLEAATEPEDTFEHEGAI